MGVFNYLDALQIYSVTTVCLRVGQFFQLSFLQYIGLCEFRWPISFMMIVRTTVRYLIIKSEVSPIRNCLGLCHETIVCDVCLSICLFLERVDSKRNIQPCLHHHTLSHWGRVTHICVSKITIIGSDNGLSQGRRQAITWTNVVLLLIGPLGTNSSEILIEIDTFSFKKMHLKMSSGKWRPFFVGLSMLTVLPGKHKKGLIDRLGPLFQYLPRGLSLICTITINCLMLKYNQLIFPGQNAILQTLSEQILPRFTDTYMLHYGEMSWHYSIIILILYFTMMGKLFLSLMLFFLSQNKVDLLFVSYFRY